MKKYLVFCLLVLGVIYYQPANATAPSQLSEDFYLETMETIRDLDVIIGNFGTDEQKAAYEDIKIKFQKAAEKHFAQEYVYQYSLYEEKNDSKQAQTSIALFMIVKQDLANLLDQLAVIYLKRTQDILDATSKNSFDIFIKYNKKSGLARYFYRSFDPLRDIKPYKASEYHFFRDKLQIAKLLETGYKQYQSAFNKYNSTTITDIKVKKVKSYQELNYLIETYMIIIKQCRMSKQCGIEIHRFLKNNELDEILNRYDTTAKKLTPIFDDRIPPNFKIDAIDNVGLVYAMEQKKFEMVPENK